MTRHVNVGDGRVLWPLSKAIHQLGELLERLNALDVDLVAVYNRLANNLANERIKAKLARGKGRSKKGRAAR